MNDKNNRINSKNVALSGVMIALSMLLGYFESLVPLNIGVPGVKLGLANIVIIVMINKLPFPDLIVISLFRVILSSVLFGNVQALIFSVCGALFSLLIMYIMKRSKLFGTVGISIGGGVAHNIGQLVCALFMIGVFRIIYYLPVLLVSGVVSGMLIGIFGAYIGKRMGDF